MEEGFPADLALQAEKIGLHFHTAAPGAADLTALAVCNPRSILIAETYRNDSYYLFCRLRGMYYN